VPRYYILNQSSATVSKKRLWDVLIKIADVEFFWAYENKYKENQKSKYNNMFEVKTILVFWPIMALNETLGPLYSFCLKMSMGKKTIIVKTIGSSLCFEPNIKRLFIKYTEKNIALT